ncbi:putative carboxylesterase 7 [Forsythia ovata]|uniref:Carboxylesterase 7 n=1 Tax=Forsythia ovata TaxID=205694 RepID=A0ABD1NYU3_9LAMI
MEIAIDFSPYFRIYKDGKIERLTPSQFVPSSDNPESTVRSKDVVIQTKSGVSARIFMPKVRDPLQKVPLLVYIHGGAFVLGSPANPPFHNFVSSLVEKANIMAISVDYRLAPEHPLPIAFDDSWTAFQWVISHVSGKGPDPWINKYADFGRVFLGGESAGANIAHDVAIRAGEIELGGVEIVGLFLVHPYFGGKEVDKLYKILCPASSGCDDDPRLNPAVDPRLRTMAARRVIFCLAEKDFLRERGMAYYERLKKSEWIGEVEFMETEGEGHGFHMFNPNSDKAEDLVNRLATFLSHA